MRFHPAIVLGCLCGIVLMAPMAWAPRHRILAGVNDFVMFYAGAKLSGTPDLYNPARVRQVQGDSAGSTGENYLYCRPPYLALLIRPLGRMPYHTAYLLWQLLLLAGFAGFLALWRPTPFPITVLFSCLSLPLFACFMNAQDLPLLLLWIALSLRLEREGRHFWAGLIFSFCAAKFHLFLLVALLIVGQRLVRFAFGLAAGGLFFVTLSFATAGLGWPARYWEILKLTTTVDVVEQMPNLRGLFFGWPHSAWWEGLVGLTAVIAVWIIVRNADFEMGLAAALAGGLLIGVHGSVADAVLLLPACLIVYARTAEGWPRALAIVLLMPVGYVLWASPLPMLRVLVPLSILGMLYSTAFLARLGSLRPGSGTAFGWQTVA
ncbi:MAG TPA: glycosyltransferase 87 family protein [Bryobacterales bacterium]|nr:glycosyltransferase 87 family protein [Bryobacterales bacterium]